MDDIEELKKRMTYIAEDHRKHEQGGGASDILYESIDAIEHLQRELEAVKIDRDTFRHGHRIASDSCVRLERELEDARKIDQSEIELFRRFVERRERRAMNAASRQEEILQDGADRMKDMLALYQSGGTMQEIGDQFGLHKATVSRILRREILRRRQPIDAASDKP